MRRDVESNQEGNSVDKDGFQVPENENVDDTRKKKEMRSAERNGLTMLTRNL